MKKVSVLKKYNAEDYLNTIEDLRLFIDAVLEDDVMDELDLEVRYLRSILSTSRNILLRLENDSK